MKKVYLVRHGETIANAESIVQDGAAVLSPDGRRQAEVLAGRLSKLNFQNLIVSDYVRTRETVEPLLKLTNVTPVYSPLVRELRRPSQFVGMPRKGEAMLNYINEATLHVHESDWHFADEENYFDILKRLKDFFAHLDNLEGDTIVVSHGRFNIFAVMYVIMGGELSPEKWRGDMVTFTAVNTGISVIGYKEDHKKWSLITYNDHAHFAE